MDWWDGNNCILHRYPSYPRFRRNPIIQTRSSGPVADKITPRLRETAKMLWIVYFGFTLLQILLLGLAGMPWFDSVCHALTTMPTGGFSTQNASIGAYSSPLIQYIIISFMFIAGVNFTLHFRALTGNFKAHIKDYEFRVYLTIIIFSSLIIFYSISSDRF